MLHAYRVFKELHMPPLQSGFMLLKVGHTFKRIWNIYSGILRGGYRHSEGGGELEIIIVCEVHENF